MLKTTKKCSKCLEFKEYSFFYKNGQTYRPDCKECKKKCTSQYRNTNDEQVKICKNKYYHQNKTIIAIEKKIKYNKNKDLHSLVRKEQYKKNPDKYKIASSAYYHKYKDKTAPKRAVNSKKHYYNNKGYYYAKSAKRRADKYNTTLVGYSKELNMIYNNCPNNMDVDHIIPLKGVDKNKIHVVCGLHVPWNLQYLDPIINKIKSNKV